MTISFNCVSDFKLRTKQKLPKELFDYIEGGAGDESVIKDNLSTLKRIKLIPQIPKNNNEINIEREVLDTFSSAPFGISPMGITGLVNPKGDDNLLSTIGIKLWNGYAKKRKIGEFSILNINHPLQNDGHNCGIFTCKIIEQFIMNKNNSIIFGTSKTELFGTRKEISNIISINSNQIY